MKSFKQSAIAIAFGILAAASMSLTAADKVPHTVMVKVDRSGDNPAVVDIEVDGQGEVFTMPELAEGESQVLTTESGKQVTLTRTESGMTMLIDGKSVQLPDFKGHLGASLHRSTDLHQKVANQVHISGVALDDNQKQIIRDAFLAAGVDKEVQFSQAQFVVLSKHGIGGDGEDIDIEISGDGEQEFQYIIKTGDDEGEAIKTKKKHVFIKKHKEDNQ